MSQPRTRVAVVFGGRSTEHAVSCVSAGCVMAQLDPERYEVVPLGITREGSWVLGTGDLAELAIHDRTLPSVDPTGTALALTADPGRRGEVVRMDAAGAGEVLASVDVVFPVLHGAYGEDGTLQGMLELAELPYVGAGVLASAAGMDKEFTKKLLAADGLPVGTQVVLRPGTATLSPAQREIVGLPAFVKPARGGSSIGISRVPRWEDLDAAIALARRSDPKVVVERAVVGREVECGVLELPDGSVRASLPAEIHLAATDVDSDAFYDFETKYLDDAATYDVPAQLGDELTAEVQRLSVAAFRALDGQGLARVDFFLTEDGPVVNEVNTMPGFTPISMYPQMWAASGLPYAELLSTMVETALARGTGLR
ncbi:D-alanine--D-alanine ligase family protein [Rhodococcus aerolatus]